MRERNLNKVVNSNESQKKLEGKDFVVFLSMAINKPKKTKQKTKNAN